MASLNLVKYFSQWDGDNGGAKGACGETCLKMIDNYLTGREVAISDIIKNGDNNPAITTIDGMKKAADWLGFGLTSHYSVREADIKRWLSEGKLIIAILKYGLFPAKYKQDQKYQSGHFVLVTGITDDGKSIRFADPNFWGNLRNDGWMDNNKWASYGDFYLGFYHNDGNICRNGSVLVSKQGKLPAPPEPPAPPVDPCATMKQEYEKQLAVEKKDNGSLRDQAVKLTMKLDAVTTERDKYANQLSITMLQLEEKEREIKAYQIEQNSFNVKLAALEIKLSENDGEIFTLTQEIERLKLDATKELTIAEAILFILNKLSGRIKK